jgi:Family of unknown function (DUF5808)
MTRLRRTSATARRAAARRAAARLLPAEQCADPRVFTPKAFGWGLGVNWYWLVHPLRFIRARRSR